ncbi:Class I peptide chain release factor [Striga hermonthica]|uniref:Class I peptide chain release factor n=1 Tax=Striga hermonthica TaxID=68872 RepID=A0A9N7MUF4_STRHE|nr:Class I peptide chain release factor [Striga hermonthica]
MAARSIFHPRLLPQASFRPIWPVTVYKRLCLRAPAGFYAVRCSSTKSGAEEKKPPARLAEVQRLLHEAEERYKAAGGGAVPIPQIKLDGLVDILQLLYPCADHVTVSYARTVNTKVDMRFNVKNARWLSERVREKIMQMNFEKLVTAVSLQ